MSLDTSDWVRLLCRRRASGHHVNRDARCDFGRSQRSMLEPHCDLDCLLIRQRKPAVTMRTGNLNRTAQLNANVSARQEPPAMCRSITPEESYGRQTLVNDERRIHLTTVANVGGNQKPPSSTQAGIERETLATQG